MSLFIRCVSLSIVSAVLLTFSFPNFNQTWCAWVALIPWFFLLQGSKRWVAFGWSYLIGLLFFLGSMCWLLELIKFGGLAAILGWLVLSAYLAFYFGFFGLFFSTFHFPLSTFKPIFLIPSLWVSLEYIRSHALSGFGWNLLGYSQTRVLPVIQIADLTGALGVSFLVVLVNTWLFLLLTRKDIRKNMTVTASVIAVVALSLLYGGFRISQVVKDGQARIVVVQGNIPQEEKWDEVFKDSIFYKYEDLTRKAARENPDLIIWPETALPGVLDLDEGLREKITGLIQSIKTPVLVSSPMASFSKDRVRFTNSAILFGSEGKAINRYDKLHLVPFGEFVPFEDEFPVLREILPPIGDFVPGKKAVVFQLATADLQLPFSVLICFEDVFPQISRQFVKKGARLLATITNDAWFGKTAAPYQHAQTSTFRAVELRVPMVRAANTGWSGLIDSNGRWLSSVKDGSGQELFVDGFASFDIKLDSRFSLYRMLGDYFAWLCLIVSGLAITFSIRQKA